MKALGTLAIWLLIIGGINWGLVGLMGYDWDLVAKIFGGVDGVIARIVYILVGLSGLVVLVNQFSGSDK